MCSSDTEGNTTPCTFHYRNAPHRGSDAGCRTRLEYDGDRRWDGTWGQQQPHDPYVGVETEFVAVVSDTNGGITNESVEIRITGPDGVDETLTAEIPADDPHFHWTYRFPKAGEYEITVSGKSDGQEYDIQFTPTAELLPAKATGNQMQNVTTNLAEMNATLANTSDRIDTLESTVQAQAEQINSLESQLSNQSTTTAAGTERTVGPSQASEPGFTSGIAVFAAGALALVGYLRRSS